MLILSLQDPLQSLNLEIAQSTMLSRILHITILALITREKLSVADSNLCLVDSWASVIQLNLVYASDALAFSVFESTVSRMHALGNALIHGIAAAIEVSNFRLAFLMMSLYSSSLGSIE